MPLRHLFVDMNAYFASVEQQDQPALRGLPVAVIPMAAETTCVLAASYVAKRSGIKTGTPVWQARQLCPGLRLVVARPERYVEVHKEIVGAVGRVLPISKVWSIDEMACRLAANEREPAQAERLGRAIKAELRRSVGGVLTCSIGAGPSVMLAKVAGDMQKPDGLTLLRDEELVAKLSTLKITDFPGIGPRMEKRFLRYGLTTVPQLLSLSLKSLSTVWGSRVHGERWYHWLRGEDVPEIPTRRRTVGHSHVLPPALRTRDGSRGVLIRLIHKACARLRALDHWAGTMDFGFKTLRNERWAERVRMPHTQETWAWLAAFAERWERGPKETEGPILHVWMVLHDLIPARAATPSLIEADRRSAELSRTMDAINRKFGKQSIRFGGIVGSEETAPLRIAFSNIPKLNPATV